VYRGLAAVGDRTVGRVANGRDTGAGVPPESATFTEPRYQPAAEHALLLQEMPEVGATVSMSTGCDCVTSTLPATSHARNFTVLVALSANGPL
jgi:hypothetical protein